MLDTNAKLSRDAKYIFNDEDVTGICISFNGSKVHGCSEVFHVDRLQMVVIDHVMYSPHKKVGEEQAREIMDTFGTNMNTYPRILEGDPIVRFYGWKKGDLIQITLADVPEMTKNIKYRVVA